MLYLGSYVISILVLLKISYNNRQNNQIIIFVMLLMA